MTITVFIWIMIIAFIFFILFSLWIVAEMIGGQAAMLSGVLHKVSESEQKRR